MDVLSVFPQTSSVSESGHLFIGGMDCVELADDFGTPLFVYDDATIRANCRRYRAAFAEYPGESAVVYAGKAFLCIAMAQVIEEEGLWLDLSSGGEIYTAYTAGFPMERTLFHGNNKTRDELDLALQTGVGYIVLDNIHEIDVLSNLLARRGKRQRVLIRVTPGIIPSTHAYVQTGQVDSKFGFGLASGAALEAVWNVLGAENLIYAGLHIHIGSQIFALQSFRVAAEAIMGFLAQVTEKTGTMTDILNLGGGLGIRYKVGDEPSTIEAFGELIAEKIVEESDKHGTKPPLVMVEPGRSIVGDACVTLYRVGSVKEIPGVRTYVSVDGGMSDNLRPMLYGSLYEAILADRADRIADAKVTIAGKHCESGDVLINEAHLPRPRPGDVVAVPATGAYGYAMANNYNRQPRPAVVLVRDGTVSVMIERETYEDLVRLEQPLREGECE